MEAQLDPIFKDSIDAGRIPGACAVAYDVSGKRIFSKGYGNTVAGDTSSPMITPDTPCLIWSCTKLVTCVAALQLVEKGKLSLEDLAEKYVPEIAKIQLLEGFDGDGKPILRDPQKKITILNLITHTGGFAYDFFDQSTLQWRIAKDQPPVAYVSRSAMDEYTSPLIFEPGQRWEYGVNVDWLGYIVAKISGVDIASYIDKNIMQPLGLKNTVVTLTEEADKEFMIVHAKSPEGQLTPTPTRMVQNPESGPPGGHYLYSTCDEYANFLLTLLNNGTHPKSNVQILKPETVKDLLFTDQLPRVGCGNEGVGDVPSTVPAVVCKGAFMPGVSKGWSCGLLLNHEDLPNGRSKGSGAWAGLGNCYYFVDPAAGKLAFLCSAILPFFDKDVLHLFDALERAMYGKPMAKSVAEAGSNFTGGDYIVQAA